MDLRQVVETAKRILMKEKVDKQLAGQTSSTPFMSVRKSLNKRVTFHMTDDIEQKTDKLMVMMGKLVTEDEGQNKTFKRGVYQSSRDRGQNRGNYQGRFRYNNAYRGFQGITKILEVGQDMVPIIEVVMVIIYEVIRGMGDTIVIIEGVVTEIKIMIGI